MPAKQADPIYRLKVSQREIKPRIWRRVEVPGGISLGSRTSSPAVVESRRSGEAHVRHVIGGEPGARHRASGGRWHGQAPASVLASMGLTGGGTAMLVAVGGGVMLMRDSRAKT